LLALALDACFGEPPPQFHPVVWMGHVLRWLESRAPHHARARLGYGLLVGLGLPLLWAGIAARLERRVGWPILGVLLAPTFAGRALLEAAARVEYALVEARLAEAQHELRWLVSRPTESLDEHLVSAAAIESVAENFVDSWLAPLLAYAAFGLAGAYAYRAANTADAMWGYRTPTYEWLGKGSARIDDVLNWVPARLGAAMLVLVAPNRRRSLRAWLTDASRTASPNAGQTMAVVAGALCVRLEKRGHYILNPGAGSPSNSDIGRACRIVRSAMIMSAGLSLLLRMRFSDV
jgi:adenosylcobinamide-phosphate synthase